MKFDRLYFGSYLNIETDSGNASNQKQVDIYIYDSYATEIFGGDTPSDITDLELTDTPCRIENINNGEDKFEVFRPKRAVFEVYSSGTVDIEIFAEGGDRRWYVEIYYDLQVKFKGWLSISDLSQDFLPDPNVIILTALDGLGLLEGDEITKADGDRPEGVNSLLTYICGALSQTGMDLEVWCVFNIRESTTATTLNGDTGTGLEHFFMHEYLDVKTFEKGQGALDDAKTVLEKILKREAYLTQQDGHWLIIRIDELQAVDTYKTFKYGAAGDVFIGYESIDHSRNAGAPDLVSWMNDDQQKTMITAFKKVVLTYNYNLPAEIPCNKDFSRGDFITDLADETIGDQTYNVKKYEIDCWTLGRWSDDILTPDSSSSATAYIKKYFQNGYEKLRFLELTNVFGEGSPSTFLRSDAIFLQKSDKGTASINFKFSSPPPGNDWSVGGFHFVGNSGNQYSLNSPLGFWSIPGLSVSTTETYTYTDDTQKEDFVTQDYTIPPVPEDGRLYFFLEASHDIDGANIDYNGFELTIYPFINGSYQVFTGQEISVTQPLNPDKYKQIVSDETFMADAPRRNIKGCLLKTGGVDYVLTEGFYNAAVFPDGPPDSTYIHPYYHLQVFDVWNQINRVFRKFEGDLDHLDEGNEIIDLPDLIILTDASLSSTNKAFMVLHYDSDLHKAETGIVLVEVSDSTIGKQYPTQDFKYLQ